MEPIQRAQELIDQLASDIDLPGLHFDEAGVIDLQLDDGRLISLGVDDVDNALAMLALVLAVPPEAKKGLLYRLLEANAQSASAGGPAYSIDPQTGCLVLQQNLPLARLSYSQFKAAFLHLMQLQETWTGELQREFSEKLPAVNDDFNPAMHLRA